ncbi:MAG: O-antigen ligase family protein [Gemmatimonadetes bacterium]|nr:O-antigen ligase family protein [Gemmatimonadota bacterium]
MKPPSLALDGGASELTTRVRSTDTTLGALAVIALFIMLVAPTRFFFIPFTYEGNYLSVAPPNLIDLVWLGLAAALYSRSGHPSPWPPLTLAGLLILGATVIALSDVAVPEVMIDLVTFNTRLIGGLVLGILLARAGIPAGLLVSTLVVGITVIGMSTIVLAGGRGPSYDFYTQIRRYGGMGLGPNEAAMFFAGTFNMLPLVFRRRPWLSLALPVLLTALLLTGSRTGVLIAAAGVSLWVPAAASSARGAKRVALWIAVIVVAALAAWAGFVLIRDLWNRDVIAPVASSVAPSPDESTTGRLEIYSAVPTYLWQHLGVLLAGVGASNAAVEWTLQNVLSLETYHTHDLFLQFLTAYGIAGLFLAGVLVFPLLRRRDRYPDEDALGLRWFGLTLVAGQLIQYGLFEVKFLLIFTMIAGFLMAGTRRNRPGSEV